MFAQKAGLFVLTLVDYVENEFNLHYINSVIEELRLVECVHIHLLIGTSSSDKFFFKKQRDELGFRRTHPVPNFVHLARTYRSD